MNCIYNIHPVFFCCCNPVWQHTFVIPSALLRRAVVSYWRKYVHEVLVNRLGGLSLPRKIVVRLTDRPDMTLDDYRGRKTTMQQHQQLLLHCNVYTRIDQPLQRWTILSGNTITRKKIMSKQCRPRADAT